LSHELNPSIAQIEMPARIKTLPVGPNGFPVPFFVAWVDGRPEFRAADHGKLVRCVREKRCWICGEPLGRMMTFVLGSMCGLNRTSSEPPSHTDCARYAARACPFLTRPHMVRREGGLDEIGTEKPAGEMITRNPGVALLWTTRSYSRFGDGRVGMLFRMGDQVELEWWSQGRPATRDEVAESVRTGLPALESMARQQDEFNSTLSITSAKAVDQLRQMAADFERFYPPRDVVPQTV
jgi:hypothetical protein